MAYQPSLAPIEDADYASSEELDPTRPNSDSSSDEDEVPQDLVIPPPPARVDLNAYFDLFNLAVEERIRISRAYAAFLAANLRLEPGNKKKRVR